MELVQSLKLAPKDMLKLKAVLVTTQEYQAIWRTLLVPKYFTLDMVHALLQIAFGWEDKHAHTFTTLDHRIFTVHAGLLMQEQHQLQQNLDLEGSVFW